MLQFKYLKYKFIFMEKDKIKNKKSTFEIFKQKWKEWSLLERVVAGVVSTFALLFCLLIVFGFATVFQNFSLNDVRSSGSSGGLFNSSPKMYDSYSGGGNIFNESVSVNNNGNINIDSNGNFETRDYSVSIETNNLDKSCNEIERLRAFSGVVFTSSTKSDKNCRFSFKVLNEETEAVISHIKNLKPKELRENIQLIKKQVENTVNRREVLEKNLRAVEQVLNEAILDYDDLQRQATAEKDILNLTNIIKSKTAVIDDLRARRERAYQEIDNLNRALADQEDRLQNTYFSVSVYELKYFDGKNMTASWKSYVRDSIIRVNEVLQDVTVGLIGFAAILLKISLYIIVVAVFVRVVWRTVKRIIRGKESVK